MKFKSYLNESVRMDEIDEDSLLLKLHLHCKKNLKLFLDGSKMYRGTRNEKSFYEGNSNKGEARKSANTRNYYTLLMDNTKNWKDYPKRSRSFICSTYENAYGNLYFVIPYDGIKIGMCPQDDIWQSFYEVFRYKSLNQFNNWLYDAFDLETRYNTWDELKKDLNEKSNEERKKGSMDFTDFIEQFPIFKIWGDSSIVNFTDEWEEIFNPKKNHFQLKDDISNLSEARERELWFSGKAIFIEVERYKTDMVLRKKILDVSKGNI